LKWIAVFQKIANHAVLLYPGMLNLPTDEPQAELSLDARDRYDHPEKFASDQELTRLAFPDVKDRYASQVADMDSSLCGKWPVRRLVAPLSRRLAR
jgi:hypothetical protein